MGLQRSNAMQRQIPPDETIFELGRTVGSHPKGWAGMCPYPRAHQALQKAVWLRGFSQGRLDANLYQVKPHQGCVEDLVSKEDQKE